MRPAAFLIGAGLALAAGIGALLHPRICCLVRGHRGAVRQPMGGWRCGRCGLAAVTQAELLGDDPLGEVSDGWTPRREPEPQDTRGHFREPEVGGRWEEARTARGLVRRLVGGGAES